MDENSIDFCPHRYCIWPKIMFCEDTKGDVCPAFKNDDASTTYECCGIISEAALRGMLLHHAGILKCPVVMLLRPLTREEGCKLIAENRAKEDLLRQESTAFYTHNDSACAKLHGNDGWKYCFVHDSTVGDWMLEKIGKHKDRDCVDIPFACKTNATGKDTIPGVVRVIRSGEYTVKMVVYTCLLSGYSEIAVLVECFDVRGVMIVGQTILKGSKIENIERVFRAQVAEEYEATFGKENFPDQKEAWVRKIIAARIDKQKPEGGDEAFLQSVADSVAAFQTELKGRYDHRVKIRGRQLVARAEQELDEGVRLSKQSETESKRLKEPSSLATEKYRLIANIFKETLATRSRSEYETDAEHFGLSVQDYLDLELDPRNICVWSEPFDSVAEYDTGATGFFRDTDGCRSYRYSDNTAGVKTIVSITDIRDPRGILSNKKKRKDVESIFMDILQRFLLICAQLRAEFHQGRYETFTRSMRHELGQLHGGHKLALALPQHLFEQYGHLTPERTGFLIRDFDSYLNASLMRVRSTKYMDTRLFPPPEYLTFYPYSEVLFRWKEIYRRRARQMQIDFRLNEPEREFDPDRPPLCADRDQFEQIAYNLTNNAFKYAFDGTCVEVDCRLDPSDSDFYCFRVVNYSFALLPGEEGLLGQYGFRARNAKHGLDGTGLGLWYCGQLAVGHGGDLRIVTEAVSDYAFRSLLLYRSFSEKERALMYKKARDSYEIALEDHMKTPEVNPQPRHFPFSSEEEMGQALETELLRLKNDSYIWTRKADQFNSVWRTRDDDASRMMRYSFSPFIAGGDLMKGTMRFTVTVRLPKKRP